jgi:hypothetical protein
VRDVGNSPPVKLYTVASIRLPKKVSPIIGLQAMMLNYKGRKKDGYVN